MAEDDLLRNRRGLNSDVDIKLPATKYSYSKWLDFQDIPVCADQLHSPRIRKGPEGYDSKTIGTVSRPMSSGLPSGSQDAPRYKAWLNGRKSGRQAQRIGNGFSNWESCTHVNLSYQDLGDPYQHAGFMQILGLLLRVEELQLMDNWIGDLSSVHLARCRVLHLQRNNLCCWSKLPSAPALEHLSLQQNNIQDFDGASASLYPKLKSLVLLGNPVTLLADYRKRAYACFPLLEMLDHQPVSDRDRERPSNIQTKPVCSLS